MRLNASSAACLEVASMATLAQAEALHTLAVLPGGARIYAGAASVITAWHLHKTSKLLRQASAAFAAMPCAACPQSATCDESELLEANMRSCLSAVDRLLNRVGAVSYAGWFSRTAARSVADAAGELADLVDDYSYIRTGGLASAMAAAETDRASGAIRPLHEYLSH